MLNGTFLYSSVYCGMGAEEGVYGSGQISNTKIYSPTLLVLQEGGGGIQISTNKHYVTFE